MRWEIIGNRRVYRLMEFGAPDPDGRLFHRADVQYDRIVPCNASVSEDCIEAVCDLYACRVGHATVTCTHDALYIEPNPSTSDIDNPLRVAASKGLDLFPVGIGTFGPDGNITNYRLICVGINKNE